MADKISKIIAEVIYVISIALVILVVVRLKMYY